jgi:hypothetical protein
MVNVICMKWGTVYGPEYVNRLASMVRRQLARPHRFVCFTDDATGVAPGIETRPLPPVRREGTAGRFWNKLGIFSNPLADLTGPVLWLDLDVVIVDRIDCFFEVPGEFCIIREFENRAGRGGGNSSVCRFTAGAHAYILEEFYRDPAGIDARYAGDQDLVSATVKPLTFWPAEWCRSFKKHCLPPFPRCYFQRPFIPPGARIIIFHGHPNPPDAIRGCRVRHSLKYARATPWVLDHWR